MANPDRRVEELVCLDNLNQQKQSVYDDVLPFMLTTYQDGKVEALRAIATTAMGTVAIGAVKTLADIRAVDDKK